MEVQSLNHQTTREVPNLAILELILEQMMLCVLSGVWFLSLNSMSETHSPLGIGHSFFIH